MDRSHITNARILANALRLPISDETDVTLARYVLAGCAKLSGQTLNVHSMTTGELADRLDEFTDRAEIQDEHDRFVTRQVQCN